MNQNIHDPRYQATATAQGMGMELFFVPNTTSPAIRKDRVVKPEAEPGQGRTRRMATTRLTLQEIVKKGAVAALHATAP